MLDGSIIATIISVQPAENSVAWTASGAGPAVMVERRAGRGARPRQEAGPGEEQTGRRAIRRGCPVAARVAEVGRGEHLVVRQAAKRKWPWRALLTRQGGRSGMPCFEPSRVNALDLRGVDRGARDRREDGLREDRQARRSRRGTGSMSASATSPSARRPLPSSTQERDRRPLDGDDLADEPREVGDRAAELPGEHLEHRTLLLGAWRGRRRRSPPVQLAATRTLPGMWTDAASVSPATSTPSIDPVSTSHASDRVAGAAVGVLPHPARAEHVAGADLEEPAFDVVAHGCLRDAGPMSWCESVDRPTSVG